MTPPPLLLLLASLFLVSCGNAHHQDSEYFAAIKAFEYISATQKKLDLCADNYKSDSKFRFTSYFFGRSQLPFEWVSELIFEKAPQSLSDVSKSHEMIDEDIRIFSTKMSSAPLQEQQSMCDDLDYRGRMNQLGFEAASPDQAKVLNQLFLTNIELVQRMNRIDHLTGCMKWAFNNGIREFELSKRACNCLFEDSPEAYTMTQEQLNAHIARNAPRCFASANK